MKFKTFSIFDLVLLAMLTAVSIAFKVVAGILVRMITGPLGIPGGAVAGGFYMLWLVLGVALTKKHGSAFVISLVQVIVMLVTGAPGSHGIWSLLTYLLPAFAVELVFLVKRKSEPNVLRFVIATMLANAVGTFSSNALFFRLSPIPLLFTIVGALASGAVGGAVASFTYTMLQKTGIMKKRKEKSRSYTRPPIDSEFNDTGGDTHSSVEAESRNVSEKGDNDENQK